MKNIGLFLVIILGIAPKAFSQTPIDVTDQTIKLSGLGGSQDLYFGFAEGDQIVFSFTEVDGKPLKQVDISEYPSTPKFSDYKTAKIDKKILNVNHKAIYKFHFENSAIGGRICKIEIQRIPASEVTKNFNTDVETRTIQDTSYTIEQEKFLVKSDTTVEQIASPTVKVHSSTHLASDNTNTIEFTLPENTRVWSYYIGVSQEGEQAFNDAVDKFSKSVVGTALKASDPLAALAITGVSFFTKLTSGDAVTYYFLDGQNENLYNSGQAYYYIKTGNVMNDFARMEKPLVGTYYVRLVNSNLFESEKVFVKIVAIRVNQQWDTRQVKKMHVENKEGMYLKD